MRKLKFYDYFYMFLIGSIFGWILEGIGSIVIDHMLLNHSALVIGPFNVIYGVGACVLTAALLKFKDKNLLILFLIGFVGGSIVEYFMSWGMELVLGFTAWNYSKFFLNINGRICLAYSCIWGVLSIVWIKYLYPLMQKLIDKINPKIGQKLIVYISIFLAFDVMFTAQCIIRAKACDKGIAPQNGYERFLDNTFNSAYLKNMFSNHWE